ncbi:MAG: hypothetical protein J6B16_04315 [Clostridia bacterium]|nr:hypothetical protein [Clostridia bacterium]
MNIQSLNGLWDYRVSNGKTKKIKVPFSTLAVGCFTVEKTFNLSYNYNKVFIKFDRITYSAKVTLNDKFLGELGPYSEYEFDISDIALKKGNKLKVEVLDLTPEFGPSEGWENYGGIISNVSILYRDGTYIDDVYFHTKLKNNYLDADYVLDFTHCGEVKGTFKVALLFNGKIVDSFTVPVGTLSVTREVLGVNLWSPDHPNLYLLRVDLIYDGKVLDTFIDEVGFREFSCNRHRFLLNGKEVFLQGVCRHEMIGDYGHTVPIKLVKKDLLRIKKEGCNYIRLVHYPHDKSVLKLCDRIGLMTSEEPGLWWSDTSNKSIHDGSIEVLKRTIKRDRNHPSIVFWLCFNECLFTESFLVDSAKVCKQLDPYRLVSGANCMSDEDTLKYYNLCGFDFYTMHPYSAGYERAENSARILHDKPLMFTEWGGFFVYDNPHLIKDFIDKFIFLYNQNSDEGALAGACFWYWREVNDFGRGEPACIDGTLKEALVDKNGKKTLIYDAYFNAYKAVKKSYDDLFSYKLIDKKPIPKKQFICNAKTDIDRLIKTAAMPDIKKLHYSRYRKIVKGPVLRTPLTGLSSVPYALYDGDELLFNGGFTTDKLTLIGATSILKGYPYLGALGEVGANINVYYKDGDVFNYPLKNGEDFTSAFTHIASSRVNPVAKNATKFLEFSYDKNFENYLINRLVVKLPYKKEVSKITITSQKNGYVLLFYGIFAN